MLGAISLTLKGASARRTAAPAMQAAFRTPARSLYGFTRPRATASKAASAFVETSSFS
jgi:hypothetical protein